MELGEEIVLRPRFKINVPKNPKSVLNAFEAIKKTTTQFKIATVNDHVYIKIPKKQQHFWSPQLHIEVMEAKDNTCSLHGFFGPNPTVWTMFMFFHFIIAILFIGFGIWAYTNYSLDKSFALQLAGMFFMSLIWIALYIGGRLGKGAGKKEMHALYNFMKETLQL